MISLCNHCLPSRPQEQDTGWLTSRAPWFCLPRASWKTRLEVWMKTKGRTPEWTVPFFKCHACKTLRTVSAMSNIAASFRVFASLTVVAVGHFLAGRQSQTAPTSINWEPLKMKVSCAPVLNWKIVLTVLLSSFRGYGAPSAGHFYNSTVITN